MSFDHEAHWSARYRDAGDEYLFGTAPNKFLAAQAERFGAGMNVLSVADGEGRNAVWLAEQGCRVTATEISPVALEKAAKLARVRRVAVDFVQVDILNWDWPEAAYDAVLGIFIQFATPAERPRQLAGMKLAVKPGGLLLLQGYTPKQLEHRTGGPSAVENLYTEAMLRELFADWDIVLLREHEDTIEEGTAHAGRSALIDLVARKPTGR
ncbi:SAM-dependent methyltransferase [Ferribacterium limneticum]|uniref:SAM-dependent methyltransferase n=1 Tax=Ferribacterium limneticum TaxID=76259 RepID=UPI001CF8052F|nr:class I SAM-dependent methyltransferase [Ferribacterium limneticum]UCV26627.1 class I SAM-dependent methyltransferase [Ferribacterium limneticum]UCV30544.1 class I SAM-dependent methyltransferase [Ferribacterium limneticum]